jgi:hypothetical protein
LEPEETELLSKFEIPPSMIQMKAGKSTSHLKEKLLKLQEEKKSQKE